MDSADTQPPQKKARNIPTNICILCNKLLAKAEYVKNPTAQGLQSVFAICESRKDHVYENIWPYKADILNLNLKVSYHVSCRAS